jgi:DNA-binding MarR family transcriptional regulator
MLLDRGKQPNIEDLLLALRRKIIDSCKREGIKYDLTFSQMEITRFIGEAHAASREVTMKNIADHLKITPPSATTLIAEMEKKGMIKRKHHPDDRRVVSIVFTPKAATLFERIYLRKQNILHAMVSKLNDKDQKSLERIITILITE